MILNSGYSVVFVVAEAQGRILGEDTGMEGHSELAEYHEEGF